MYARVFPVSCRAVAWECKGLAVSSYTYIVSCYRQKYIFFESARNRLIWTRSSSFILSSAAWYRPGILRTISEPFLSGNISDGAMRKFIINKRSIIYFVAAR